MYLIFLEARVNVFSLHQLSDVIGELSAIRSTINDFLPGAQQVMLTLRLERYLYCYSPFVIIYIDSKVKPI